MPAGQIIGRVSVKVLPDTSDFKRDAKKKLAVIEKQLGELRIQTKIDMSGAKIGFLEELNKLNQKNRSLDSHKIRFYAVFNKSGMADEITKAMRELQLRASARRVEIKADLVAANSKLELDEDSLDHVKDQLHRWRNNISPLKVKVHPEMVLGATTVIEKRMDYATRPRTIPVIPYLTKGGMAAFAGQVGTMLAAFSGARIVKSYLTDLWDAFKNLDKAVPIIGAIALTIAGLSGLLLTATSNVLALLYSLGSIGPLALLLPGLMGGMALGLGASYAVFKDFSKILPEVKGQFTALQDQMSAKFWAKAKAPIQGFINTLLPQFSEGLTKTSVSLGIFFGGLATSLKGGLNGELASMFADLSESIKITTSGTDAFAGIIKTLGEVGGGYLPQLAQWFVDISTRFDNFLTKAQADGRLKEWIDTGLAALKDLGSVLSNLGGIITGLGRAAAEAGGSTLGILADTLTRIHDTIDSPAFQEGLVKAFSSAHEAMTAIADGSGPALTDMFVALSDTMTTVMPVAGKAIGTALGAVADAIAQPEFQKGLTDFFNGILAGIEALAPAMGPIGIAFGVLGTVLGDFMAAVGPTLGLVFTELANALIVMLPALTPIVDALAGIFMDTVVFLVPVLENLAGIIHDFAPELMAFAMAAGAVKLGMMAVEAGKVVVSFYKLVLAKINVIAGFIEMAAAAVWNAAVTAAAWVAGVTRVVGQWLLYAAGAVASAASATAAWLLHSAQTVASLVVTAAGFIAQGIVIVASMAATVVSVVAGWVLMGLQSLLAAAQMAAAWLIALGPIAWVIAAVVALAALIILNWDTIKNATIKAWNAVFTWLSNVWGKIKTVFSAGVTAVVGFVTGLWASVSSKFSGGIGTVVGLVTGLWSQVGAKFSAAKSTIGAFAAGVWRTVSAEFSDGVRTAIEWVAGIPGKAVSALGDLGSTLVNAGRQLIAGFVQGIKNAFGSVKTTLSDLTSKLTSWKGPESLDKVLLVNAGQVIIDGLITGLESRYDAVHRSLSGLTSDIGNTTIQAPAINSPRQMTTGQDAYASTATTGAASQPVGATSDDIARLGDRIGAELQRQARTIQTLQRQVAGAR